MKNRSTACVMMSLIVTVLFASMAAAQPDDLIFRVSNIGQVDLPTLVEELKETRVVVVGEQHNNRLHHEIQLAVIRALKESGRDVAVGLEMFVETSQPQLDRWTAGKMNEEDFFRVYSANWDINLYPIYRPIFVYARDQKIPMVGLNVPRQVVRQVARQGFDSLSEQQRGEIKVASCNIDLKYQETLARVLGSKGQGGPMFTRFCEAQVVWDTAMAINTLEHIEKDEKTVMVVLAGNFHAWKRGIAEQIERRSEIPVKVILPSSDSTFFNYDVVLEDADYVWWVGQ